eukprot:m.162335 g.162335  ORF g.162335 m.162335 type:complete len:90 (+) comp12177_c0_seq1:2813-3082(+)
MGGKTGEDKAHVCQAGTEQTAQYCHDNSWVLHRWYPLDRPHYSRHVTTTLHNQRFFVQAANARFCLREHSRDRQHTWRATGWPTTHSIR